MRTGSLGDTITALPALRLIRQWAPKAKLTLLCDQALKGRIGARAVIEPIGVVDYVEEYIPGNSFSVLLKVREIVKRTKPERVIVLGQARATAVSLIRLKLAFKLLNVPKVTIVNPMPAPDEFWPTESERLCIGLRQVGFNFRTPQFDIPIFSDAQKSIKQKLDKLGFLEKDQYLVFCPGGKSATQHWPLIRYTEVLSKIVENNPLKIIAIGSGSELQDLKSLCKFQNLDICFLGDLEVMQIFELIRGALAYIGNDTGPMHVAAAVSCPVIAVFSARNRPGEWFPEIYHRLIFQRSPSCRNCFLQVCTRENHRCMTEISASEVQIKTQLFLDKLNKW